MKNPKSVYQQCVHVTAAGPVSYLMRRSPRRRTIEISVDTDLRVKVAAPRYCSEREVRSFIEERAVWIRERLKEARLRQLRLEKKRYRDGNRFLFLGKKYPLTVRVTGAKRAKIGFSGEQWYVWVPAGREGREKEQTVREQLHKWYRAQAMEIFGGRVFHFSRVLRTEPRQVAVRGQKRIWGSCDHGKKVISLNWHLVMSPLEVIDYVVVHELCHIFHPNHSARFWKKVENVLPDYKMRKKWLKDQEPEMALL